MHAQSIKAHILCIPVLPAIDIAVWQFLPSDRLFRQHLRQRQTPATPAARIQMAPADPVQTQTAPAQMQTVPAKSVPMPMPHLFPPHPVRHAMVMTVFPLTPPTFPMGM